MIAKPLLKATTSLIVIAALTISGCATPTATTSADAAPAAATVEEAQAFVTAAEAELTERLEREGRIAWIYNTYINYDTEWLLQRSDAEATEARVRLANEAARFADLDLDAETRRKLDFLRLSLVLPAPARDGAADELSTITTR